MVRDIYSKNEILLLRNGWEKRGNEWLNKNDDLLLKAYDDKYFLVSSSNKSCVLKNIKPAFFFIKKCKDGSFLVYHDALFVFLNDIYSQKEVKENENKL